MNFIVKFIVNYIVNFIVNLIKKSKSHSENNVHNKVHKFQTSIQIKSKCLGKLTLISDVFSIWWKILRLAENYFSVCTSFSSCRLCQGKRKFQLLNRLQQHLTSNTRYIDVIITNFSKKMPKYATKHPVAYLTWSRLTNLIFAWFFVVRWDRFRKFRAFILHNF